FTIYYKSIAFDQSVRVNGSIRPMFIYRQVPERVPVDSKQEFRIFLTNNTDEAAAFGSFDTDGKFYVINYPRQIPAGGDSVITLKRNPIPGTTSGSSVSISLQNSLKGRLAWKIPIH